MSVVDFDYGAASARAGRWIAAINWTAYGCADLPRRVFWESGDRFLAVSATNGHGGATVLAFLISADSSDADVTDPCFHDEAAVVHGRPQWQGQGVKWGMPSAALRELHALVETVMLASFVETAGARVWWDTTGMASPFRWDTGDMCKVPQIRR